MLQMLVVAAYSAEKSFLAVIGFHKGFCKQRTCDLSTQTVCEAFIGITATSFDHDKCWFLFVPRMKLEALVLAVAADNYI